MSIPARCTSCNYQFTPNKMIEVQGNVTGLQIGLGNRMPCPMCGAPAHLVAGTYDFVNGVIAAFTAPGMSREKVEAAKNIAKEASEGAITTEDALHRLEAVSATLAMAVAQHQGQSCKVNWEFLLTLFALIWTIWSDHQSDADAQAALAEARTQTEVAEKLLEESQAQSASLRELATKPMSQPQVQAQKTERKKRAERRKQALEGQTALSSGTVPAGDWVCHR
jgi:rubredoxin